MMIQGDQQSEIWIETKSENGKCYYYNAKTRETTWTKPENKNVFTQEQFLQNAFANANGVAKTDSEAAPIASSNAFTQSISTQVGIPQFAPNRFPPPFMHGFAPPGVFPFGAAIPNQWIGQQSLISSGVDQYKQQLLFKIDPELRLQAADWSEHKTPDGKCYYFSAKTQKSVWEKPKILVQLDEAIEEATKQKESEPNAKQNNKENITSEVRLEVNDVSSETVVKKEEPRDKSKPVSSTPISGTPWCVVWTGDNRVFFFNPSTKSSLWECPPELKNRHEIQELTKAPPKAKDANQPAIPAAVKRANEEEEEETTHQEVNNKKLKPINDKSAEKKETTNNVSETETAAAKQRESLPIEERTSMFKAMLLEKEVSAFSTWEKELHKIVFDERYLLITSKERKQVFEQFVKERAEEERKEKRQRQKLYREQFLQLLEESNITSRTSFSTFTQKFGKDGRFRNIERSRDRESYFNEFISDLKRKERDDKEKDREKAKANFLDLLKEQADFIHESSTWSEVKEKIRNDARYKALESSSTKEVIFKEFISRVNQNLSNVDKEISESLKQKEKQEKIEASIREREKEVQRELSAHLRQRDKERDAHLHAETIESFTALLIDLVKMPSVTWREARKMFKKDHRWELVESLDRDEMERLFESHIENLVKKKREKFHQMLEEIKELNLSTTWRDIRRMIKDDSRYLKYSTSDRKCEREFNEYMKVRLASAKNEFKELLKETKLITYKTKKMIEESEQPLQDIIGVLQNDKRYLTLENFADDRRIILINYISELHRLGPPKPITASEPPRRK